MENKCTKSLKDNTPEMNVKLCEEVRKHLLSIEQRLPRYSTPIDDSNKCCGKEDQNVLRLPNYKINDTPITLGFTRYTLSQGKMHKVDNGNPLPSPIFENKTHLGRMGNQITPASLMSGLSKLIDSPLCKQYTYSPLFPPISPIPSKLSNSLNAKTPEIGMQCNLNGCSRSVKYVQDIAKKQFNVESSNRNQSNLHVNSEEGKYPLQALEDYLKMLDSNYSSEANTTFPLNGIYKNKIHCHEKKLHKYNSPYNKNCCVSLSQSTPSPNNAPVKKRLPRQSFTRDVSQESLYPSNMEKKNCNSPSSNSCEMKGMETFKGSNHGHHFRSSRFSGTFKCKDYLDDISDPTDYSSPQSKKKSSGISNLLTAARIKALAQGRQRQLSVDSSDSCEGTSSFTSGYGGSDEVSDGSRRSSNSNNVKELEGQDVRCLMKKKTHKRKAFLPMKSAPQIDEHFKGVIIKMRLKKVKQVCKLFVTAVFSRLKKPLVKAKPPTEMEESKPVDPVPSNSVYHPHKIKPKSNFHHVYTCKHCASCGTKKTPLWRDAEDGTSLCNACGIRYKKYRIRCPTCWYIPRKEGRPQHRCKKCGDMLRIPVIRSKAW